MNLLENIKKEKDKQDYNDEPVYYCKECLSLKIRDIDGIDFCDQCGKTDIGTLAIEEWEISYKEKYGNKFLNIK